MTLERSPLGDTGVSVSRLGLGCGRLADAGCTPREIDELVDVAMELGITLFDAARSYGDAESEIGRAVASVRDRVVLSTKVGYGVDGIPDWTGPCVSAGVDAARDRLRVDVIDIVHLHSCPADVLAKGDVVDALSAARAAGKIRAVAYSGENEALAAAIADPRFDSVQTSVSPCDPASRRDAIGRATARGLGVIAKRPLANAFWRFADRPSAPDVATYWDRGHALGLAALARDHDLSLDELCLRFSAFTPGVHTAIVGTARPEHLRRAAAIALRGPLPAPLLAELQGRLDRQGHAWPGVI